MRVDPIILEATNKLISEYRNNGPIMNNFHYKPFETDTYHQRVADLREREFDREGLTSVLYKLNRKWNAPEKTFDNIQRLKHKDSVVVIGGQQAGLLSGPIYTIHKIISIINFAKEQEKQLDVPVIPVFWIAGEDHDFEEVNHVMFDQGSRMKKYKIPHRVTKKISMSELELDKDIATNWADRIFEELRETKYTKHLYKEVHQAIKRSTTYVDFFARVIFSLFKDEGLVLIDSGHPLVRKIESEHFVSLIKKQPMISREVFRATQDVKKAGYSVSVDVEETDAHLFYHQKGERVLLHKVSDDKWMGKQNECEFSTAEILDIAKKQPELLSNNVVTRPIMQELLFPSLAFLGGLAEVGYWSILKPAFETLNLKMPPVLPRLSFSLVDQSVEKIVERYCLQIDKAVNNGVDYERVNWLATQTTPPIDQLTDQVKFSVENAHRPLKELAQSMRSDLGQLAEKNLHYLFRDIEYLGDRLMIAIEEENKQSLANFDLVQTRLRPENGLQERSWNVLPFINEHGSQWISKMIDHSYDYNEDHYLVYLRG